MYIPEILLVNKDKIKKSGAELFGLIVGGRTEPER